MSARAIAIRGNEKSGERRANLEIKSECPALHYIALDVNLYKLVSINVFLFSVGASEILFCFKELSSWILHEIYKN